LIIVEQYVNFVVHHDSIMLRMMWPLCGITTSVTRIKQLVLRIVYIRSDESLVGLLIEGLSFGWIPYARLLSRIEISS
jgi:hypothetical protein